MPPLNQAERRKAFLNFLIFFVVTVTVIVVVIFFSIEVPFVDNRRLRSQVDDFQSQKEIIRSLQAEFNEVSGLIRTLDAKDVNQPAVSAQIDMRVGNIANISKSLPDSQSINYYSTLTNSLLTWKNLKKDLGDAKNKEQEAAVLKQEIAILKAQLAQKDQLIFSLTQQQP